jgi:hypothetical protein
MEKSKQHLFVRANHFVPGHRGPSYRLGGITVTAIHLPLFRAGRLRIYCRAGKDVNSQRFVWTGCVLLQLRVPKDKHGLVFGRRLGLDFCNHWVLVDGKICKLVFVQSATFVAGTQ